MLDLRRRALTRDRPGQLSVAGATVAGSRGPRKATPPSGAVGRSAPTACPRSSYAASSASARSPGPGSSGT